MQEQKKLLFEYFVYLLNEWKSSLCDYNVPAFTKLRLQKLLFLASTINASVEDEKLLGIFNRFGALPYGPVELDIYDAMTDNTLTYTKFDGNECCFTESWNISHFDSLDISKRWIEQSVNELKIMRPDYLYMPIFNLVEITHQWTAWQTAFTVAELLGNKCEMMSVKDICNSKVKAY